MKWFVGVLVIANLGYFGYQFSTAAPRGLDAYGNEQAQVDPSLESMGGLLLLTELDGQTLRPRRPRLRAAAEEMAADTTTDTGPAMAAVESQTPAATPADAMADSNAKAKAEPGTKTAADPAEPQVPSVPEVANGEAAADEASSAVTLAEQDLPTIRCFTAGPLEKAAPINRLTTWFKARSLSTRLSPAERREVAFHWVYFAPSPSRKEALAKVAAMRDKGIDDMVVMRKGDMAHGISLGAFSRASAANRRVRELRAKGYEPSIDVRHFVRRSRWMDVVARNNRPEADFAKAFPALQLNERSCEPSELKAGEVSEKSA